MLISNNQSRNGLFAANFKSSDVTGCLSMKSGGSRSRLGSPDGWRFWFFFGLFALWGTPISVIPGQVAAQVAEEEPTVEEPKPEEPVAAESKDGMVATVHPLATAVALQTLRDKGNAVDAAIAAAMMLGVVDSHNSGIGGSCFILIRGPDGKMAAIDGRETAPAKATRDMYVQDGKAVRELSRTGPLAVAVPGALAAYALALKEFGTKPFADLVTPAAEIAEDGFDLDSEFANCLKETRTQLEKFEGPKAIFFHADGSPYAEGETLKQPHLAETYRELASNGPDWFYKEEFAERVGRWMSKNGGILTKEDFANYQAVRREPLVTKFRDLEIVGFPPPSSGGIHVAQILGILEPFDIGKIYQEDPAKATHIIAEAMELAFADRAYWLGDADVVHVPKGLLDPTYWKALSSKIDPAKNLPVEAHGTPPNAESDYFAPRHTTHISVVDKEGYWVGITATVNTTFGSKVIVPGTGVFLNNEMDDFSIQPGVPNAFQLIGAENNSIAAGKRPLSSMSPTIVLKDGEPVMVVGAGGGPKIITQVVLMILRYFEFGMSLEDAISAPRFHHQWRPDKLMLERGYPADQIKALKAMGHEILTIDAAAVCQAIIRTPEGALQGVHDPRVPGKALGP
ncbi:MAG TPA: gamma-glutamyltransferase [Pirellulaceae bacterium]